MARHAGFVTIFMFITAITSTARAISPVNPASLTATASSVNYQLEAVYSCNGNGLTGDLHTNDIGGEPPAAGQGTMWLATGIAGQWIQYQFDTVYSLGQMWVWNYNQVTASGGDRTGRGVRDCKIEYSTDGADWNQLGGVHTLAKANASPAYAHNTQIDFGGVEARYVKITVVNNHGDSSSSGLSEVRFFTAEPDVSFLTAASGNPEAVSPAILDVVLSPAQPETVRVDYAVTGGSASPGVDYLLEGQCDWDLDGSGQVNWPDLKAFCDNWLGVGAQNPSDATGDDLVNFSDYRLFASQWFWDNCNTKTLEFTPGQTSATIEFAVIADDVEENDETIVIDLSNPSPSGIQIGNKPQHVYTIQEGPGANTPKFAFSQAFIEADEGGGVLPVQVSLWPPSSQVTTVDFAVTGGSATGDRVDYIVAPGTLTFQPSQTSQSIIIRLSDDVIFEEDETILLELSNPVGGLLGETPSSVISILDNDGGIRFDGLRWFHSEDPSRLTIDENGNLRWDLQKPDQLYVRLPEQRLSQTGDVAEFSYLWKSIGDTFGCDCGDRNCTDPNGTCCFDDDVTCVAGTGDFRMGLFDSRGQGYIEADGTGTDSDIFSGYYGYRVSWMPHVSDSSGRFVDSTGEVHKPGYIAERTNTGGTALLSNNNDYNDLGNVSGFELPIGTFSLLTFRLERLSSDRVRITISLNGSSYSTTDSSSSRQPQKIDVFAIHMPNARPYEVVVFGKP